jgi:hypothetical protein
MLPTYVHVTPPNYVYFVLFVLALSLSRHVVRTDVSMLLHVVSLPTDVGGNRRFFRFTTTFHDHASESGRVTVCAAVGTVCPR